MKLLDGLSTYTHQTNFYQARKKRYMNTATWLFSISEFTQWKDGGKPSVFILTGKRKFAVCFQDCTNLLVVGSGKTVLTLVLILQYS